MLNDNTKTVRPVNRKFLLPLIMLFSVFFLGWGHVGHHIISYNTILSALPEMNFFEYWADSLAEHASDADYRKSVDPNEAPKHYIDIDNYPEFLANGTIPQDFDSIVAIHGYSFVIDQGILPWAILWVTDSLQTAFENNDWNRAMLLASDLGHYIADAHMPLHITKNYNGQYTNQNGVHSRYESNLIGDFQSQIEYDGDSLVYIDNLSDYVFNMLYENYQYVDSVLYADSVAHAYAGNTQDTAYYNKFWELTKNFTIRLFKNASYRITCVIYTAWINAGGVTNINISEYNQPNNFNLFQNYPNPFNPSTTIRWYSTIEGKQSLKVFDNLGREVANLFDRNESAGTHELIWNAEELSSGIYFYQLKVENFIATKKMLLLK
jgi:Secretion system C-terminal sorting domain